MTNKTIKKHYSLEDARIDLTEITKSVDTVLANAEKRRADVARKLSATYDNKTISALFAEFGIKVGDSQVGRDVIVAKVTKLDSTYDYSTLQDALRNTKKSGLTITALKKITENPNLKSAEKVTALNALVAPTKKTSGGKGTPRQKWELAKEQLDKMLGYVEDGKMHPSELEGMLENALETVREMSDNTTDLD